MTTYIMAPSPTSQRPRAAGTPVTSSGSRSPAWILWLFAALGPGCGTHPEWEIAAPQTPPPPTMAPPSIPTQKEPAPTHRPEIRDATTETVVERRPSKDALAGWPTHRIGAASFRYPPGWSVESGPLGLVLVPADHRRDRELIIVTGNEAPGLQSAADPLVGQTLDGMVASSMPGLRRRGRPQAVDAGRAREGMRYDYSGYAPDGRAAVATVYVIVEKQRAAAISLVGDSASVSARRSTVERIFRSFDGADAGAPDSPAVAAERAAGDGPLDPRLIGMFGGESIHSSNGVYVNSQLVYALGADGVMHYGARSHLNASQGDGAGGFRWTATGSTGGNVQRGTWTATGGLLRVQWDSASSSSFAYGFEPDGTLALRHPVTRKLINIYSRLQ